MKIELKRFSYSPRLSQETNAFAADIWIDGKRAGFAENDGHGGCTMVHIRDHAIRDKVEAYARTLLPAESKSVHFAGTQHIIDELVEAELQRRHDVKEAKRIAKYDAKETLAFAARGMKCARFRVGNVYHWIGIKPDQPIETLVEQVTKKYAKPDHPVVDWTVLS